MFPSEIIRELRIRAQDAEDGERNPITGISSWPKEETIEWMAANLLDERKQEIDKYETFVYEVFKALKNKLGLDVKLRTKAKLRRK
jgi:hypothetical protein